VGWDDQDLIFTAIATSGLSRAAFAARIVRVPVRAVERWLTGVLPIPVDVRNHLESFMAMSPDERYGYIIAASVRPDDISA
jgi:hypothetical protein